MSQLLDCFHQLVEVYVRCRCSCPCIDFANSYQGLELLHERHIVHFVRIGGLS